MNEVERESLLSDFLEYLEELDAGNYSIRLNVEHCEHGHTHVRVYTQIGVLSIEIDRESGEFRIEPLEEAVSIFPPAVMH